LRGGGMAPNKTLSAVVGKHQADCGNEPSHSREIGSEADRCKVD